MRITDYRDLMRALNKVEPGLSKKVRAEARRVAEPLRREIKAGIPKTAPLSKPLKGGGMVTPIGRLSWGRGKPADSAVFDTRAPRKMKDKTSLIKIKVGSPATVMADMMGRSGRWVNAKPIATGTKSNTATYVTRDGRVIEGYRYTYHTKQGAVIGGRQHRIRNQGRGLIKALGSQGSRWVWKSAERGLPAAKRAVSQVMQDAIVLVNESLRTR
jgi:hypothetical protein